MASDALPITLAPESIRCSLGAGLAALSEGMSLGYRVSRLGVLQHLCVDTL